MNILEIDDNPDIVKLVQTVLSSMDHTFTSADNGKDGLELIRANTYDMVLLDLSMPGFSGLDVVDALVKDGIMDKQKIVLFTASTVVDQDIHDLLEKGVDSYLSKPVDIDVLLDKVDEIESKLKIS